MTDFGAKPTAYLDSNIFIYPLEGRQTLSDPAQRLFRTLGYNHRVFVTSELTIAEVFAPSRERSPMTATRKSDYGRAIEANMSVRLVPATREILLSTIELREQTRHKLLDAIHAATALSAQCRFFVSHDRAMLRLPRQIRWLDVSENSVTVLLEALRG